MLGLLWLPASYANAGTDGLLLRMAQLAHGQTRADATANVPSAKDLLARARVAMREGRFDDAEALIADAERMGRPADTLVARFEDTPEKARAHLAALRTSGGIEAPAPGRSRSRYSGAPNLAGAPMDAPRGRAFAGPRDESNKLLLSARQALASGNADQAAELTAQAKRLNLEYDAMEDSPQKVESLIIQHQRFVSQRPSPNDPNTQRQVAHFLMDQAEQLLNYGDVEMAQKVAQRAKAVPGVKYTSFERSPDMLLQSINSRRQALAGQQPNAEQPRNAGGGQLNRLPPVGPAPAENSQEARRLIAQARMEIDRNNLQGARQLAERAKGMNVEWQNGETQPWQILMDVESRLRHQKNFPVAQAGYEGARAIGTTDQPGAVRQGVYQPEGDPSRVVAAANVQPAEADPSTRPNDNVSQGQRLYEQGLMAMENQDSAAALDLFRQAWRFESELDPATRQQLKDKLTYLGAAQQQPAANGDQPSPIEEINSRQQMVQRQMFSEITNEQRMAEAQRVEDPLGSLNRLQKLRARVNSADLDPAAKKQFLTFVDNSIRDMQGFIEQNRAEIELNQHNTDILNGIERDQQEMLAAQDQIARMVEDFNSLMDERRFAEAEVVAKQAREIAPENPVVVTMVEKSRFAKAIMADMELKERKENSFTLATQSVDESSEPFDDRDPIVFAKNWQDISRTRERWNKRETQRLSVEEAEIRKALNTKVNVNFTEIALQDVLKTLCDMANVPMFIDPQGLALEAVTTDQPVSIALSKEISLKSALNLILDPLRLSYIIDDDVLKITSEGARNSHVYPETYNVADLVIPIPNFVPGYNVGLPAAIREAYATVGQQAGSASSSSFPLTIAADELQGAVPGASALAQLPQTHGYNSMRGRPSQYSSVGPGGMGGAALADFDTLIELITSTVATDTWEENGGTGAIEPFPTNLSLVISQTQDVHEQIADLLEQLRRLQDLQVTLEVRFITLSDDFFERIGIDFDFDIDDNTGLSTRTPLFPDDVGPSIVHGLDALGAPTNDLDLQFRQDNFGAAVPQFGGFDINTAANFGFAILSDVEVFFLLQAAQGDRRSNILQAPKVTLFDGQTATIADTSSRPFVVGIIPVVGDFAAAHQPVVTVLNEGTTLSVQAVVSHDRRFVRLTLVPFFSQIGDVDTFRFVGSTTSDSGTNILDSDGNPIGVNDNVEQSTEGAVVQLPTFQFTTVSTTVNVPDGGTVLLGGIKRLREGRNERGVPMLGKLPYVNRLFKNVGIGRETQSLMLMATPRIIIQAEEEAKLGVETQ